MALEGKVAVVYAGACGIGKAYCEVLLQKGCKVFFGDILQQEGIETQKQLQEKYTCSEVLFRKCDVLNESEVKDLLSETIATFGVVDIVIANAGIIEEKNWQKCLDINLVSVMRIFYSAMEHMSKTQGGKGGQFVVTSSTIGIEPVHYMPAYTATKFGTVGFIRAWGTDKNYQLTGIGCNAICPRIVKTKMTTTIKDEQLLLPEHANFAQTRFRKASEENKMLQPEDIGSGLTMLLEDEAANGQCLVVTKEGKGYVPFTKITMKDSWE